MRNILKTSQLKIEYPIGDVRAMGLLVGVELVEGQKKTKVTSC